MASTSSENAEITVLMPTYNGQRYVREQLASIYNQDLRPTCSKVLDDCSTDDTLDILQQLQYQYKGWLIVHQNKKESGLYRTVEKLLSFVNHGYIALADQDDIWCSNKLYTVYDNEKTRNAIWQ